MNSTTEPTTEPNQPKGNPVTLPTEIRRAPITIADLRQATSLMAFWAGDGRPDYDSYDEALELVPWDRLTVALLISALCETACELAGNREAFRRALDAQALRLAAEEGEER